jgi:beta-aspartyl-dipeptidase (metallo-type)
LGGGGRIIPPPVVKPLIGLQSLSGQKLFKALSHRMGATQANDLASVIESLREEGLSAWCMTGGYHVPPVTLTGSVRGDLVHVDRVIACGEIAISDHRSSQPTLEEILKLAGEAHVGGLLARKAGILHLHVGDGARALELIDQALDRCELPARVFQPTHVNRRKALFEHACALARRGVHVDLTAFPVAPADDAWSAAAALMRYLDADLPANQVTISSDAGGSLPEFHPDGTISGMGIGSPGALAACLAELLATGQPLERVLPAFTSNAADLLRLPAKGRLAAGCDADLCVLDDRGRVSDVMARGAWHLRDGRVAKRGTFERE